MERTCIFEKVGRTLLLAHDREAPGDREWAAWLQRQQRRDYHGILVSSQGGGPTSGQRKQASESWKGKEAPPIAIVTDSTVARGIVTAFGWIMGTQLRAFDPAHLDDAMAYLTVPGEERELVRTAVTRLHRELGAR